MPFRLCEWLVSTSHSIALRESRCMFLVVRTVHVLTLTVFSGNGGARGSAFSRSADDACAGLGSGQPLPALDAPCLMQSPCMAGRPATEKVPPTGVQYRQIFLDGRPLPTDPEPAFKGYSVGRWDGDTLIVQTTGYNDDQWLDAFGHPLTAQARTTERIRRVNYGSLEVQLAVDDPKAYAKPWTTTIKLSLALNTELLEYVCNENEKSRQHMVGADAK